MALEETAAKAGVTRGAVYHHFAGKPALFAAVLAQVQSEVADAVGRAASVGDLWPDLEAGCRAFLVASLSPDRRRIMLVDAPAVLGWATWRRGDAVTSGRLLDNVLADLHATNRLAVDSVPAAAALLSGAMNEVVLWSVEQPDPQSAIEQAWIELHRLLSALRK